MASVKKQSERKWCRILLPDKYFEQREDLFKTDQAKFGTSDRVYIVEGVNENYKNNTLWQDAFLTSRAGYKYSITTLQWVLWVQN